MALWLCFLKYAYLLRAHTQVFVGKIIRPLVFPLKMLRAKTCGGWMKPD